MTKIHLSERERYIFVVCLLTIFVFLLYRGIYIPLKNAESMLDGRIKAAEKRLAKTMKTIRQGNAFESDYQTVLARFKQSGSDEQVMSAVLAEVEAVAGEVQMGITDMKPKRVRKVGLYNDFSVGLTVDGELSGILLFINTLQNPPHGYSVEEFKMEKNSTRATGLRCQLVLTKLLVP